MWQRKQCCRVMAVRARKGVMDGMEEFLAGLHFTTASGFQFVPSLPHLFLILIFLICSGLIIFCGVILGRACPCLYFGVFCAFLSMQNLLPIFTGPAMWIPLLVLPGCFSAIGMYLFISFIMWLVDAEKGDMSDSGKKILSYVTAVFGTIAVGLFLYIFVTHSFFIIFLACASLLVLGIMNQKKIIINGHRFKTYNDLYDINLEDYKMHVSSQAATGGPGKAERKKTVLEAEERKKLRLPGLRKRKSGNGGANA